MHADDDTIPHAAKPAPAATGDRAVEVALGDTVAREPVAPATPPTGRPAPETPPLPAALRPHHRVRVGTGEPIELDRPVHIGRRPRPVRVPMPALPRLVTVASPEGGISSTHLELREQGAAVVATDMRSLNGSEVRVPGSPTRTLLRGESVVVTPGTRIDLGEGVVVEILGPARTPAREERMHDATR
ncbi:MAG: hypothetical protein ACTHMQ_11885 [Protaetiibacter sp.]